MTDETTVPTPVVEEEAPAEVTVATEEVAEEEVAEEEAPAQA